MTTTWTLDAPPVLTREVMAGRVAIVAPVLAAALVAIVTPTDAGVVEFTTTPLGAWAIGLGALLYAAAVVGPFVRAVARYAVARDEWARRARPASFRQGVLLSLLLPTVATAFFLHGLAEWDTLANGAPAREDARVASKASHAGKGCHWHVVVAGSERVDRLDVCMSSASRWASVASGEVLTLDVVAGPYGQAVRRIVRGDGSTL